MATYWAKKNPHPRDKDISLDEPTHTYTINGESGKHMSVTRWIHGLFPAFDAEMNIDKMMASDKWSKSKYFGMTKEEIKRSDSRGEPKFYGVAKMKRNVSCFCRHQVRQDVEAADRMMNRKNNKRKAA